MNRATIFFDLVQRAAEGTIRINCGSAEKARTMRAAFNSWKADLKREGRAGDLSMAREVSARVEDSSVVFEPKSDSWIAATIAEALKGEGK